METFTLICSSLACRISGSRPLQVEAADPAQALVKYPKCLKCGGEMKGKSEIRSKRK